MKCTSCGAEIEAHAKFCSYCGSPAPTPQQAPTPPITTYTTYDAQGRSIPGVPRPPAPPSAPQPSKPQPRAPQYNTPPPAPQKKQSGLVYAILSIVFALSNGLSLIGLAFGIAGIVRGKRNGDKASFVCGIVGTVLCSLAILSAGYIWPSLL